jgi:hypothetical protein
LNDMSHIRSMAAAFINVLLAACSQQVAFTGPTGDCPEIRGDHAAIANTGY